ncbi:MAG: hypothetical protein PHU12_03340 [Candidatus Aenigmarchaeota archaeon]|nr:hypothetical protein [Candidatus Aenigmarchaeota archaeon]
MARITETQYNGMIATEVKSRLWKMILKSFVKLFIVMFVVLNFTYIYPVVSLVVLFAAYFSMPTSYSTDQPWKGTEAWMRLLIGFCLAALMWSILTFDGSAAGFTQAFLTFGIWPIVIGGETLPIYLIVLAFFCTFPKRKEVDVDMTSGIASKIIGENRAKTVAGYKDAMESAGNILFILLMVFAGLLIFQSWLTVEALKAFSIMFMMFWALALVSGWMGGREGRPYVGVMMLVVALFIFSFAYTGTAGSAVFGQYWPTVEHYGAVVFEPIMKGIEQANQGINDAWLMMTCPACYYEEQQKKLRGEAEISEDATKKSIALTQFNAVNYNTGTPKIDPSSPLIGSIILENQGTFTAENVNVTLLDPKIKNPKKTGAVYNSELDCYEKATTDSQRKLCTYTDLAKDKCRFYACPGADNPATNEVKLESCLWMSEDNKVSVPGDKKLLLFICGDPTDFSKWSEGTSEYEYINQCSCKYPEDVEQTVGGDVKITHKKGETVEPKTMYERISCDVCIDNEYTAVYTYASYYLSTIIKYSFNYKVDVQTPVTIMDSTIYMDKLVNNEIKPKSVESKYNGGPAMISIWLQAQPLRDGETSYGTATITNTGTGNLMNGAIFRIKVPKEYVEDGSLEITSHTRLVSVNSIGAEPAIDNSDQDYYIITAKLNAKEGMLKQGEVATFTFNFKGILPEGVVDKSALLLGDLDYRYETDKRLEFPILEAPIQ